MFRSFGRHPIFNHHINPVNQVFSALTSTDINSSNIEVGLWYCDITCISKFNTYMIYLFSNSKYFGLYKVWTCPWDIVLIHAQYKDDWFDWWQKDRSWQLHGVCFREMPHRTRLVVAFSIVAYIYFHSMVQLSLRWGRNKYGIKCKSMMQTNVSAFGMITCVRRFGTKWMKIQIRDNESHFNSTHTIVYSQICRTLPNFARGVRGH